MKTLKRNIGLWLLGKTAALKHWLYDRPVVFEALNERYAAGQQAKRSRLAKRAALKRWRRI